MKYSQSTLHYAYGLFEMKQFHFICPVQVLQVPETLLRENWSLACQMNDTQNRRFLKKHFFLKLNLPLLVP